MTLIVGIKCADGVVVGADGAATLGNPTFGQQTVLQPVTKLQTISEKIIMGVSGPVGLGQLYCDSVEKSSNTLSRGDLPAIQRKLCQAISKDVKQAVESAEIWKQLQGPAAIHLASTSSLIALTVSGSPELIQCNQTGQAEAATDDLPYVAIGSGQPLADPFLAFLRKVFWANTPPRLAQGILATVWTLTHAIGVAPGGVAFPIQVMTLTKNADGKSLVESLADDDLQVHQESVAAAEQYLASFPGGQ